MTSDSQAHAAVRIAIAQAVLTALIATFSGCWAFTTYTGEQRRIAETRSREQRQAQDEAIAEMSRQLGLMEAQCEKACNYVYSWTTVRLPDKPGAMRPISVPGHSCTCPR